MADHLRPLPLSAGMLHLCIDMQRLFSSEGPWPTPWMNRVLPVVAELAGRHPERTIFTRFIPPQRASDMPGMWQRYYARWEQATREHLDPALLALSPPLAKFCPPAIVIDKPRYSAFFGSGLAGTLRAKKADGLIVSGSETDVCVLATVMAAVDLGYRVVIVADAVCSSSDEGHDALMDMYHRRYSEQIEVADAASVLERWER